MNEIAMAYLAGILDGEGCIHIAKYKGSERHKTPRYTLTVKVSMIDKSPLELAYNLFSGYLSLRVRENTKWKPIWEWGVTSEKAINFLRVLLPYLRTKKMEAELGIRFWNESNHKGLGKTCKSSDLINTQESYYIQMKLLKDKSIILPPLLN